MIPAELPAPVVDLLHAAHSAPGRAYHDWRHVCALLSRLEAEAASVHDRRALALAILFHDAVYDAGRHDNEARSADLARACLAEHVDAPTVDRACRAILATSRHEVPGGTDPSEAADIARFLDWDLSILGAGPDAFAAYEAGIRDEYAHVPEPLYRSGRADLVERLLARDRLFLTEPSHGDLEARARANLAGSLARLRGKGSLT